MLEKALLLTGELSPSDDKKAGRLLEFFGVSLQVQSAEDLASLTNNSTGDETSHRLVCAAETFASVIGDLQNPSNGATEFAQRIHSIFLYSSGNAAATARVASQLCETPVSIGKEPDGETEWLIADDSDPMFGAMRGLRVRLAPAAPIGVDLFVTNQNSHHGLIQCTKQGLFSENNLERRAGIHFVRTINRH